ncbi:hypothetical protein MAPG_07320 [Magnaporthiopsis poae ATCC 64411]|uniref:Phosphoglycerate mutase n=1 Tax=Magnaporthiopsis poae (strain ATCC 64411 / 73-15) TaxID=644358 RepID=A0A0C4E4C7_MAGP6|nr:hypothetical protein MAPG_07320 [Magnaporthiopsis poae ATCC 64411]
MRSVTLGALLALVPSALAGWPEAEGKSIKLTAIRGYFLQDEPTTDPSGFDYAKTNFGLVERSYPTDKHSDPEGIKSLWERFDRWVRYLNTGYRKSKTVRYKVLFMGRHGEGWHNAAERFYGTPAWNCYWAEQNGNATARWADAHLTPAGEREALKANAYYKDRYATQKMPFFDSYYSSPLARCTATANLTFGGGIDFPSDKPFRPIIKEGFREGMTYPDWSFEPGFTELDRLWSPVDSETDAAKDVRAARVLDDVFRTDDKTWLSISSHSGQITSLLKALHHRPFRLATGQIIPVLVRAEVVEPVPEPTFEAHEPYSTCNAPPVASVPGQGCVCTSTTVSSLVPAATGAVF